MRCVTVCLLAVLSGAAPAFAGRPLHEGWATAWPACTGDATRAVPGLSLAVQPALFQQDNSQPLHAAAIEHSDAYQTRAKIHKYASFATLPCSPPRSRWASRSTTAPTTGGRKAAHAVVGAGIVGLFGVNTVTGAWNMFGEEGRRETEGRTLRWVHGLLMMASDVGILATASLRAQQQPEPHPDVSKPTA